MAFGAPAGDLSKNTRNACQTADKIDNVGKITEQTTYGASIEIAVETYSNAAGNTAVSGQNGATVVTGDDYNEIATDYAKMTVTSRTVNI